MRRLELGRAILSDPPALAALLDDALDDHGEFVLARLDERWEGGVLAGAIRDYDLHLGGGNVARMEPSRYPIDDLRSDDEKRGVRWLD